MPFLPYRYGLTLLSGAIAGLSPLLVFSQTAWSQWNFSPCSPPNPGELSIMVRTPDRNSQQAIFNVVPNNQTAEVCQYSGEIVTHIRNFRDRQISEQWSRFIYENLLLEAFVVTPPPGRVVPAVPSFTPDRGIDRSESIGTGFAVLVDYQNREEIVRELEIVLRKSRDFASFENKPYLLALQSRSQEEATATLISLSNRGFSAILVNAREVRHFTRSRR